MRRFVTCVGRSLGSAAALALAVGCSHEARPAETPAVGTSSPPFESNVPPTPPPGPPGSTITPEQTPGQPREPGRMGEPGSIGQGAQPGQTEPRGAPGEIAPPPPQTGAAVESERMLCNTLASNAKMHVEDVQNGVAIVLVPKTGHDLSTVREDAHRLEGAVHQPAGEGAQRGEACGLFGVARMPSVTTSITDGTSTVRIVMTTSNPTEIKDLRRSAREQVNMLAKPKGKP